MVGINYAPEHTGIAPYTTLVCEHLLDRGADVQVLAGVPHYPHWTVPEPYRRRLRVDEQVRGVPVRRLRHFVPAHQSALRRSAYEVSFGANALLQRLPWSPDVVLAVVPSLFGAAAAARIARRHRARLVVWVQDLMGPAARQSGIAGGGAVARAAGAVEGAVLRSADAVIVINESFRRYARAVGVPASRVVVQPNWTHIAAPRGDRAAVRAGLGWADDETIVLHSGNMGLKQGLETVVEAARLAGGPTSRERFVLMGDGSQRGHLERLAQSVDRLDLLPPAPSEDFPDVLAAADVLLVNERASAIDMSLPSKLTSYFRAGRPVVAAVHPDGGTAAEVQRSGAGVLAQPDSPSALLSAVREVRADEGRYASLREAAVRYAAEQLDAERALEVLGLTVLPISERGGS